MVDRYDCELEEVWSRPTAKMNRFETGDYVRYTDYAKLEADSNKWLRIAQQLERDSEALKAENKRYQEALERIAEWKGYACGKIAKQALAGDD